MMLMRVSEMVTWCHEHCDGQQGEASFGDSNVSVVMANDVVQWWKCCQWWERQLELFGSILICKWEP